MKKRMLSLLLVLVMVLGMFPVTAMATEEEPTPPEIVETVIPELLEEPDPTEDDKSAALSEMEEEKLLSPESEETEEELPLPEIEETGEEAVLLGTEEKDYSEATLSAAADSIWIFGVEVPSGYYLEANATTVTETAPESPYADYVYYKDGVLTLHDFYMTGDGYDYGGERPALIYADGDLTIELAGSSNFYGNGHNENYSAYYNDGIMVTGDLTIVEDLDYDPGYETTPYLGISSVERNIILPNGSLTFGAKTDVYLYAMQQTITMSGNEKTLTAQGKKLQVSSNYNTAIEAPGCDLVISSDFIASGYGVNGVECHNITITAGISRIYAKHNALQYSGRATFNGGATTLTSAGGSSAHCALKAASSSASLYYPDMIIWAAADTTSMPGSYSADQIATYDYLTIFKAEGIEVGGKVLQDKQYLDNDGNVTDTEPAGGYAYYDAGQLTLHNYTYEGTEANHLDDYGSNTYCYGVYSSSPLRLALSGTNSITVADDSDISGYGIYANGFLEIKEGIGTLEIIANDGGGIMADGSLFYGGNITLHDAYYGVYSDGIFEMIGGSLALDEVSYPLYIYEDIRISGGEISGTYHAYGVQSYGSFNMTGGEVSLDGACDGFRVGEDFVMTGGKVNLSHESDLGNNARTYVGITCDHFVLEGGSVNVDRPKGKEGITCNGFTQTGGTCSVVSAMTGIRIKSEDAGSVSVTGGTFYANATTNTGYSGTKQAIELRSEGTFTYDATTMTATASEEPTGARGVYDPENLSNYLQIKVFPTSEGADCDIWVGGVPMLNGEYLDEYGNLSVTAPEDNYAHYYKGMLTLYNYDYEGPGYQDHAIYSKTDLKLMLVGTSALKNATGGGICLKEGSLTVTKANAGDSLTVETALDGIYTSEDMTFDGGNLTITAGGYALNIGGDLLLNAAGLDARSSNTADDANYWSIKTDGEIELYIHIGLQASTEPAGEVGKYKAAQHKNYDRIITYHYYTVTRKNANYGLKAGYYPGTSTGNLPFTANGPVSKLLSVEVNGVPLVPDTDYTVTNQIGNTCEISLQQTYLETLSSGAYELRLKFNDGDGVTWFFINPEVWVGGIGMISGQYLDEDGNLTTTKPSGDYAYYDNGELTLSNFDYDVPGAGMNGIERNDSLTIHLIGTSTITVPNNDGIEISVYRGNLNLTSTSNGKLILNSKSYGIESSVNVLISGAQLSVNSDGYGIYLYSGDGLSIENSTVTINSKKTCIKTQADFTAKNSLLHLNQLNADYFYEGIYNSDNSDITFENCDVNISVANGRGVGNLGDISFTACTLDISSATSGAIYTGNGDLMLTNCTGDLRGYGTHTLQVANTNHMLKIADSILDIRCLGVDNDDNNWAIDGALEISAGLNVHGATEPDGTLEKYDSTQHSTYDYIKIAYCDHEYDYLNGVVTTEPGCETEGVKAYPCKNGCGIPKNEPIDPLGHEYDNGVVTPPATCEDEGVRTYTCIRCPDAYTEVIPKLGHDYGDGVVTKQPTYTEKGVKTFTCSRCEDSYTADLPAVGEAAFSGISPEVTESEFASRTANMGTTKNTYHFGAAYYMPQEMQDAGCTAAIKTYVYLNGATSPYKTTTSGYTPDMPGEYKIVHELVIKEPGKEEAVHDTFTHYVTIGYAPDFDTLVPNVTKPQLDNGKADLGTIYEPQEFKLTPTVADWMGENFTVNSHMRVERDEGLGWRDVTSSNSNFSYTPDIYGKYRITYTQSLLGHGSTWETHTFVYTFTYAREPLSFKNLTPTVTEAELEAGKKDLGVVNDTVVFSYTLPELTQQEVKDGYKVRSTVEVYDEDGNQVSGLAGTVMDGVYTYKHSQLGKHTVKLHLNVYRQESSGDGVSYSESVDMEFTVDLQSNFELKFLTQTPSVTAEEAAAGKTDLGKIVSGTNFSCTYAPLPQWMVDAGYKIERFTYDYMNGVQVGFGENYPCSDVGDHELVMKLVLKDKRGNVVDSISHTYTGHVGCMVTFMVGDTVYKTEEVEDRSPVTKPIDPEVEGWKFLGWYTEDDVPYNFYLYVEGDITLHAKLLKIHTVTFKVDGTAVDTQTVEDGKTVTAPADPSQEGKRFLGWYTESNALYDFSVPVTQDITLIAKFVEMHTVTFKVDGAVVDSKIVENGKLVAKPADPSQEGKRFLGWYTDVGTLFDFSTPIAEDTSLLAKFEDNVSVDLTGSADGIKVEVKNLTGSATLIVAQYEDGKMVDVQTMTISAGNTYTMNELSYKAGCTYKALLVNSTSYAPLCEADKF